MWSGTSTNAGRVVIENTSAGTRLRYSVRVSREVPAKGQGATSANVCTGNQAKDINSIGTKIGVADRTVTLDEDTGIITISPTGNASKSWGDAAMGVDVNLTVSGSGTNTVTFTCVVSGHLTGGTAQTGNGLLPASYTVTITYTATEITN